MKIIKFDDRKAFIYRMRKLKIKSHRLHQWKLKTPKSGVFLYNHTLCKHIKQAATIGKAFI